MTGQSVDRNLIHRSLIDQDFVNLETPRLILSRFTGDDAASFFAYRADPAVNRYQGWKPASVHEMEEFIHRMSLLHPNTPGAWFQLAVRALAETLS